MSPTSIKKTAEPQIIPASDGRLTISARQERHDGPGYRWLAMVESERVKSLKEIAIREGYVSRMVNLTALAPDMVAAECMRSAKRAASRVRSATSDLMTKSKEFSAGGLAVRPKAGLGSKDPPGITRTTYREYLLNYH